MAFTKIYRHGDVIIFKLEENVVHPNFNINNQWILAEGEMTGHMHKLVGDFEVIDQNPSQGELKFAVHSTALLTHEEHDKILLESGVYLKVSQVEYDPFSDLVKRVTD